MKENTFGQDLEFLNRHVETIVLSNAEGASAVVVPAYQGRTMTSTSSGMSGASYGYLNYDAIAAGNGDPQIGERCARVSTEMRDFDFRYVYTVQNTEGRFKVRLSLT